MSDPLRQTPPRTEAIRAAALDWLLAGEAARQDGAFQAWLAAAPAHRAAFAEAERLWQDPSFLAALHAQPRPATRPRPARTRMRTACLMAASLFAIAVLSWPALRLAGLPLHLGADYTTRIGIERTDMLPDGSRLTLDTDTAVDFSMNPAERRLTLRDGRVFIAVQHQARPFRVHVNSITVEDIGTEFSVERHEAQVTVIVRQGAVSVTTPSGEAQLRAGQAATVIDGRLQPTQTIDPSMAFAWLDHRLYFQDARLGDVVAALRRYQRGWIIIARPSLAALRVSGGYDLRAPAAAILDLAKLSGASVTRLSDRLLILH